MRLRYRYLLLSVLVTFLFTFCHKKNTEPINNSSTTTNYNPIKPFRTVYVSDSLKEWGLFNVGSYWIYRDSVTTATDSVYVSSIEVSNLSQYYTVDSNIVVETIKIKTNGYDYFILSSYPHDNISMYYQAGMYAPFFNLDSTIIYPQEGMLNNYSTSNVNVFGNTFSNVRYTRVRYSFWVQSSGQYFREYGNYWKKNVGRIKWRDYMVPQNSAWYCKELIRYNVSQ